MFAGPIVSTSCVKYNNSLFKFTYYPYLSNYPFVFSYLLRCVSCSLLLYSSYFSLFLLHLSSCPHFSTFLKWFVPVRSFTFFRKTPIKLRLILASTRSPSISRYLVLHHFYSPCHTISLSNDLINRSFPRFLLFWHKLKLCWNALEKL